MTVTYGTGAPSAAIQAQFEGDLVRPHTRVDIYESDGTTIYLADAPITEGSVTVDMTRPERRNLDVSIYDDGSLGYGPDEFWYDKIIKVYRGIWTTTTDQWVVQVGEFMPDSIARPRFPSVLRVTCRDLAKKLMLAKFAQATTFTAATNVVSAMSTIATNGGIANQDFETTTETIGEDVTFERGTTRWEAISQLALSINFEVFFDGFGNLVAREYVDPFLDTAVHTFQTGAAGNLIEYERTTADTFLFNDIVVQGTGQENGLVYARAENTNVSSPTRIAKVGRRTQIIESEFVKSNTRAQAIADSRLAVAGLEQYDVSFSALLLPWLEASEVIQLDLPDAAGGDPNKFLFSSFDIPLGLGGMNAAAKRVIDVG